MSTLTSPSRDRLPSGMFGLPKTRQYPIPDAAHARAALARATLFATPKERAVIEANVHRLYPKIRIHGLGAKD